MRDFKSILENFSSNQSEKSMIVLCSLLKNADFNKYEIAELTKVLANSGKTLEFSNYRTADIPSTGGPSSLSTIITPLILKENFAIPKLGIIGRPAGGVDVLAQIEGYNLNLSCDSIYRIIDKTQYCHFLSNRKFAPLESKLFNFRAEKGFKNIPELVIASLLSKKIAVDVKNVCLDIRYSQFGNFGKSLIEAKQLSNKFKQVSSLLGVNSVFYFSDNSKLFQPYIGRGESLLAIYEYILGSSNNWLNYHVENECNEMAYALTKKKILVSKLKCIISRNFKENIISQGGNVSSFEKLAKKIKNSHKHKFKAKKSGKVFIDISKMRETIFKIQRKYSSSNNEFPDPCGLIFFKNQDDCISKNETILTFRAPEDDLEYIEFELNKFIKID